MHRRFLFRLSTLVAVVGLAVTLISASAQSSSKGRGRKYKAPPPTARLDITILRDFDGKPVENAAVVFHPIQGDKDKGAMELKTNEDGKTMIDVLPIGDTVRVQIIARGFQTYGADYKIDKDAMALEIRLKRPGQQYSIYQTHTAAASGSKSTDAGSDKSSNSAKQLDAPSSQPQPK